VDAAPRALDAQAIRAQGLKVRAARRRKVTIGARVGEAAAEYPPRHRQPNRHPHGDESSTLFVSTILNARRG